MKYIVYQFRQVSIVLRFYQSQQNISEEIFAAMRLYAYVVNFQSITIIV